MVLESVWSLFVLFICEWKDCFSLRLLQNLNKSLWLWIIDEMHNVVGDKTPTSNRIYSDYLQILLRCWFIFSAQFYGNLSRQFKQSTDTRKTTHTQKYVQNSFNQPTPKISTVNETTFEAISIKTLEKKQRLTKVTKQTKTNKLRFVSCCYSIDMNIPLRGTFESCCRLIYTLTATWFCR